VMKIVEKGEIGKEAGKEGGKGAKPAAAKKK